MKLIKYSVTYAAKSFAYQCLAHGKGHFTKRLEKAVQDHERKPLICDTIQFDDSFLNGVIIS